MNYILFDTNRNNLLPLVFTKPIAALRIGITTIQEKWELLLEAKTSFLTEDYLSEKYNTHFEADNLYINSSIIPSIKLVQQIQQLQKNASIIDDNNQLIAIRSPKKISFDEIATYSFSNQVFYKEDIVRIQRTPDIFRLNGTVLKEDFNRITKNQTSLPLHESNTVFGKSSIFLEKGAVVRGAILNAEEGPIYIGKDAEVMEGATIRGPFALCEGSAVKMGAKIYGPTTIGPYSKVGGEVNNSIIIGYSNKGHDGFLGNSVLGEWCNLGADTNNSNLKNNYSDVKLWSYESETYENTQLQFCGLIMGDHSKCGINTMFNTGTTVGVSANIFGGNFPAKFVPSYTWGGVDRNEKYDFEKAIETAKNVYGRRNKILEPEDILILKHIFELTRKYSKQ